MSAQVLLVICPTAQAQAKATELRPIAAPAALRASAAPRRGQTFIARCRAQPESGRDRRRDPCRLADHHAKLFRPHSRLKGGSRRSGKSASVRSPIHGNARGWSGITPMTNTSTISQSSRTAGNSASAILPIPEGSGFSPRERTRFRSVSGTAFRSSRTMRVSPCG